MNLVNQDWDQCLERIRSAIKSYPDFPKPGILFRDIFPLLQNPNVFEDLIMVLEQRIKQKHPELDCIIGLESRGFLIGPILAYKLKVPFVPIRKAGKLPGQVESIAYQLEYGIDRFEIQINSALKPGSKCVIIDDLLATGGSMSTAVKLVENSCQATVNEAIVIIELVDLEGRKKISKPVFSLVQY